jgi:Pyruvate/2-oxoacid:ferredoxin oxidoreductase gamma subunit
MLGCFSVFAPIDVATWKECIARRLPDKIREMNLTAFEMGRKEIEGVRIVES